MLYSYFRVLLRQRLKYQIYNHLYNPKYHLFEIWNYFVLYLIENNHLSINEKEEFNAEDIESSDIDEEFNQETEEELLDIPTFLRRQAN